MSRNILREEEISQALMDELAREEGSEMEDSEEEFEYAENESAEDENEMIDIFHLPIFAVDNDGRQVDITDVYNVNWREDDGEVGDAVAAETVATEAAEAMEQAEPVDQEILFNSFDEVQPTPRMSEVQGPSRGGTRTRGATGRGGTRTRGAGRRGRGARAPATTSRTEWHRGDHLLELCKDDADVPPELNEMIQNDMEGIRVSRQRRMRSKRRERSERESDDESNNDVYDEEGEVLVRDMYSGDRTALNFDWSPMATFQGSQEQFLPETTGPVRNFSSPYDAFRNFWDDDILQHIVVETNRYAAEISTTSANFAKFWVDVDIHTLLIFFTFWIALAMHRLPTIKLCYSSNIIYENKIFRTLMSEHRYWSINRALHLVDNSTRTPQSGKLFCLGRVPDHLNSKFKSSYRPGQNISIDESLTLWKGKLSFRQYIRTKAAKFGIKTYELCCSSTGYLWSFITYTGKSAMPSASRLSKTFKVVLDLVTPLLNLGHCLFMDNYYNSPRLARLLKRNKTDCVGTLRQSRKDVPILFKRAKLPEGRFITRHAGDVAVMAYQDKKTICMISTFHGNDTIQIAAKPGRPSQYKPSVVHDYNKSMGGVDKKDQMLEPFLVERKRCPKWYKKFLKRLINISIHNSKILFDQSSGTTSNKLSSLKFREILIKELMSKHLPFFRSRGQRPYSSAPFMSEARLVERHFIVRYDVGEKRTAGQHNDSTGRRHCVWCTDRKSKRSRTVYMCRECNVPLCLSECFENYHTIR